MRTSLIVILTSLIPLFLTAEDESEILPDGIIRESYDLRLPGHSDLNLYLKYPSGGKEAVQGVLAICKYGDRDLVLDLTGGSHHFGYLIEFAEQNQLALVAFGQPSRKGWNRTVSTDQLSNREAADQNRVLSALAREWSRTMERFARKYEIPAEGWLMYGLCGGAQYAHRIALREPDRFKAVHVHYGGSYDIPTEKGRKLFWLVTSRADEPAYIAAQRFYRQARELNYDMILKGYTQGNAPAEDAAYDPYDGKPDTLQNLSLEFFSYALRSETWDRTSEEAYTADYINGVVLPSSEASWIPRAQSIDLPSRAIAEAWGRLSEVP